MITIVDYGMGNIASVYNAFSLLGEEVTITNNKKEIQESECIVLPGVGAFSIGMDNLKKMNFVNFLSEQVLDNKKPYLGICLGLEFLAKESYEGGACSGFGWIKGTVNKIKVGDSNLKVPHIGWNDTSILKNDGLFLKMNNPVFYYVHSYYLKMHESEENLITSVCNYGKTRITSSIQKENIYAVQFHPEKSQSTGIQLLKNFLMDIRKNAQK